MPNLGGILSTQDMLVKGVRVGSVVVLITDATKGVTFSSAMPSANYRVMLQPEGNLNTVMWPTAKGTGGFTINISVGIAGTIAYIAVEDT